MMQLLTQSHGVNLLINFIETGVLMQLLDTDLHYCLRRLPKVVKDILIREASKVFVAGGFIRSCIANEKVNDIDLFVADDATAERVRMFILSSETIQEKTFVTKWAVTIKVKGVAIQIITRWKYSDPLACINDFDFTIAQCLIYHKQNGPLASWESHVAPRFYADLAARRLHYTAPKRIEEVGGSILRMLKFYQRGYRVDLPSLGALCARLHSGVNYLNLPAPLYDDESTENRVARVMTGLLFEVDPNSDFDRMAFFPKVEEPNENVL